MERLLRYFKYLGSNGAGIVDPLMRRGALHRRSSSGQQPDQRTQLLREVELDKNAILEKFTFYQNSLHPVQSRMAAVGQYAYFTPGDVLYREGDTCDHFVLAGKGSIRVFKTALTGHEITVYHVRDGQACLVNMLAIFLQKPAMATAVVEVPTEAVVFPAISFHNWVDSDRAVRKFVCESIAVRLMDVMVLAEELAFRRMDQRLAGLLLDHFSTKAQSFPVSAMTHEELARELGTAREVISKLLEEFERLGAIGISRGQIELLDKNALLQFVR